MNKTKELIQKIIKKGWIIISILVLILVFVGVTIWPLHIFKKDRDNEQVKLETKEPVTQETEQQILTSEDIKNGQYKNDKESATTYVNSTQEVQVAVVADVQAQKIIENTKKLSCGSIAFVTTRVTGPAILTNTIQALFEDKILVDFVPGNIIPTYHPDLTFEKVTIDNGVARVYLNGNFGGTHDGWCDASLAIAQITETAKTFPNINSVEVYQGEEKIY